MQQQFIKRFLAQFDHISHGTITITTPDGKQHGFSGAHDGATADFQLKDWRVIPAISAKGDIGLAETYRDGGWESNDITQLFLFGLQNADALDGYIYGNSLSQIFCRFLYLFTRNTVKGSKRNIHAHYDLGNDFYRLWLDPSMSYSSALFANDDEPLVQAQYNKYDRMLDRLNASSGRLLEVGCGWGGLAERAVTNYDFDVKGITLSQAQHDYASHRLGQNATIALQDYRHQQGTYDHILSIEMFEAVGEKFWPTYFGKMQSLLAQKGKAVIQTITIGDHYFDRYRKSGDMIRSFIFPGGMLPSPSRFRQEAEKSGLRVTDQFAFGKDYARTLQQWLETFDQKIADVKALGFDDKFIRIWRLYLACCIASFSAGRTDVMQLELQHA